MSDHPRKAQPSIRVLLFLKVTTLVEVLIAGNGLTRNFVKRDVLCRQLSRRSDGNTGAQAVGIIDRPLQCLHAAEAAADHGGKNIDTQMVSKGGLGVHPVFYDNVGKVWPIGLARVRVDTAWTSTAMAPTQVVHAHDKKSICVDGLVGSNTGIPPTRFCVVLLMQSCRVVMTGKGVADQQRIGLVGI